MEVAVVEPIKDEQHMESSSRKVVHTYPLVRVRSQKLRLVLITPTTHFVSSFQHLVISSTLLWFLTFIFSTSLV